MYKITSIYLFLLTSIFAQIHGQTSALSNRVASYEMDIFLDVDNKMLDAQTQLTWKNISLDTINELYFHMYYNAFKNSKSTFFKERGVPDFLSEDIDEACGWSWTDISSFIDESGNELIKSTAYVQTDDENKEDQTVLKVTLKEAILPGATHRFRYSWRAKIPKTMPRTGYNKDYYFFAQWFPKTGVYEPAGMRFAKEGQWNCHQYHSSGEYYSDFGNYNVKMNVPANFIVGSSGELMGQEKKGDRKIWNFKVDDVIDFSWTCSPHYVINEDSYKNTKIKVYSYPYKEHFKDRYIPTIKYCLQYLDEHLGEYPYSTLSIIDPPIHGMYTGGMEYPTLITSLSFCFFPVGIKTPETLSVHEFIHQYFMQMVATHEVEETWMDEGITSYFESRILDSYLGETRSTIDVLGFHCGNKQFNRAEFFSSGNEKMAPNTTVSWKYKHGGYGDIAYNKTALWLQSLEGMIGIDLMDEIMKEYFQKWKFKHPCRQNFIEIVNDLVVSKMHDKFPDGMDWYFAQVLYGTDVCDYKVKSIRNVENTNSRGFLSSLSDCETSSDKNYNFASRVILQRDGEIKLPLEIEITFEDGSKELYEWDGQDRSYDITVVSDKKIVSAEIDPNFKNPLDKNLINNSMTIESRSKSIRKVVSKFLTGVQHLMESISLLI